METKDSNNRFVFAKENYIYLLIGIALNLLGFFLMKGGGADNPNEFNAEEIFSPVRITVAPIMIILGYAVIIFGIMKKPRNTNSSK